METNAASTSLRIPLEEAQAVYSPPLPMSVRLGVPAVAHGGGGCHMNCRGVHRRV